MYHSRVVEGRLLMGFYVAEDDRFTYLTRAYEQAGRKSRTVPMVAGLGTKGCQAMAGRR